VHVDSRDEHPAAAGGDDMSETNDQGLSPALRELLECWDEQLLEVWLEAQLKTEWHRHPVSEAIWPTPVLRTS
jgi:hypothetical protein